MNAKKFPIAVILGSLTDLETIQGDLENTLKKFGIPKEEVLLNVISAHRNPEDLKKFCEEAPGLGVSVIIAVAGLSAALPGTIAAHTRLPVIGVPIIANNSPSGMDALLAISQMPPGVTATSVGLNNMTNAVLQAVRILALFDTTFELAEKMNIYMKNLSKENVKANGKEALTSLGYASYYTLETNPT